MSKNNENIVTENAEITETPAVKTVLKMEDILAARRQGAVALTADATLTGGSQTSLEHVRVELDPVEFGDVVIDHAVLEFREQTSNRLQGGLFRKIRAIVQGTNADDEVVPVLNLDCRFAEASGGPKMELVLPYKATQNQSQDETWAALSGLTTPSTTRKGGQTRKLTEAGYIIHDMVMDQVIGGNVGAKIREFLANEPVHTYGGGSATAQVAQAATSDAAKAQAEATAQAAAKAFDNE